MQLYSFVFKLPIQQIRNPKYQPFTQKHNPLISNHPIDKLNLMRKGYKHNINSPKPYRHIPFSSFESLTYLVDRRWQIIKQLSIRQFDLLGKCIEIVSRNVAEALIWGVHFWADFVLHFGICRCLFF